jgi:hypothetical protein
VIAFLRGVESSARCAACLALGLGVPLAEARAAVQDLGHDPGVDVRIAPVEVAGVAWKPSR